MGMTQFTGPLIQGRESPSATSGGANGQEGPAALLHGTAVLDPRPPFTFYQGQGDGTPCYAFYATEICTINAVPSALAAANIAAAQVPVAGTAMTLVSSSGSGITVGTSIWSPTTSAAVTGLLAIDSAMAGVACDTAGSLKLWDPTKAIARNVRITSVGNDSGATFTVAGYDLYGYAMTETITGANAGIASGAKAFKYIASVTPAGTLSGSNASVGTGDVFGLPIRADTFGRCRVFWNSAAITASTGFTAAVTTDPATATTGDVRGTYGVQSASDGTKRLEVYVSPSVANAVVTGFTGMFGITQA